MPIVIAILAALAGAIWWWARNNPRDALNVADDVVTIARNAPRKIAFRRQMNAHPVEGIDDPRLAVAAIANAFIALDDLPTRDARNHLFVILRKTYRLDEETAEEMQSLGQWLLEQCGGPSETMSRVGRRLYKIDGDASYDILQDVLGELAGEELSTRQQDALVDLRTALHRR